MRAERNGWERHERTRGVRNFWRRTCARGRAEQHAGLIVIVAARRRCVAHAETHAAAAVMACVRSRRRLSARRGRRHAREQAAVEDERHARQRERNHCDDRAG